MANPRVKLTQARILAWADRRYERTARWPVRASGAVEGVSYWTWKRIDRALYRGDDGLPGGISLAWLLYEHWGVLSPMGPPPLTEAYIVELATQHHRRTGRWPVASSGSVPKTSDETWSRIDQGLRKGSRSLPGRSSLARLLHDRLNVRNPATPPELTERQILAWADHHVEQAGEWPGRKSGQIVAAPDETWGNINHALYTGRRGLRGGSSLTKLLAHERGRQGLHEIIALTEPLILQWATAHHRRTGDWPTLQSGAILDSPNPGETWARVYVALHRGARGLPGGSSLAGLLDDRLGVPRMRIRTPLTEESIVRLADQHREATGSWPITTTGAVLGTSSDTWIRIDKALRGGGRGLEGGSSLAQLLGRKRGVRYRSKHPKLTERQILKWATAHQERTGNWPTSDSGVIAEAPNPRETWTRVNSAMVDGRRGLPFRSSIAKLLVKHGKKRPPHHPPRLTIKQILIWIDAHYQRTQERPHTNAGLIIGTQQEKWRNINDALRYGFRGLKGGSSIARLISKHRHRYL